MKKLIILLAALLMIGTAQAQEFERFQNFTWTLDSLTDSLYYDTTFVVAMRRTWPDGMILMKVTWDSLAGGITDSMRAFVWPCYGAATTNIPTASDGVKIDSQYVQIYDGGTAFANWTLSVPLTDGDVFLTTWEMGQVLWTGAVVHFEVYDSTAAADGYGTLKFEFYKK